MKERFKLRTDRIYNEVNDTFEVYGITVTGNGVTISCPAMFVSKQKAKDFIKYINRNNVSEEKIIGILDWCKYYS